MLSSARGAIVVDLPFSEFSTSIEFADACRSIRKRRRRVFGASVGFLLSESVFSVGSGKSVCDKNKILRLECIWTSICKLNHCVSYHQVDPL